MTAINPNSRYVFMQCFSGSIFGNFTEVLQKVSSDYSSQQSISTMYEALSKSLGEASLPEMEYSQAEDLLTDHYRFLSSRDLTPDFLNKNEEDAEHITDSFQSFVEALEQAPEDSDYSLWFMCKLYILTLGVSGPLDLAVLQQSPAVQFILEDTNETQGYRDLMDEYNDIGPLPSDDILKSIESVDVTYLPEYVIESLYLYEGKFYKPSEVRKMMTASGQVAQSLESQDLEPDMENSAEDVLLTAEQMGKNYIKKLRLQREKRLKTNA